MGSNITVQSKVVIDALLEPSYPRLNAHEIDGAKEYLKEDLELYEIRTKAQLDIVVSRAKLRVLLDRYEKGIRNRG